MKCFSVVGHKTFSSTLKSFYVSLIEKGSMKLKLPEMYIYIKATKQELEVAFIDSTDVEANIVNTLAEALRYVRLVVVVQTVRTNYLHSFRHHHLFLIIDIVLYKFSHYLRTLLP